MAEDLSNCLVKLNLFQQLTTCSSSFSLQICCYGFVGVCSFFGYPTLLHVGGIFFPFSFMHAHIVHASFYSTLLHTLSLRTSEFLC